MLVLKCQKEELRCGQNLSLQKQLSRACLFKEDLGLGRACLFKEDLGLGRTYHFKRDLGLGRVCHSKRTYLWPLLDIGYVHTQSGLYSSLDKWCCLESVKTFTNTLQQQSQHIPGGAKCTFLVHFTLSQLYFEGGYRGKR